MKENNRAAERRWTNNAALITMGRREVPVFLCDASATGARVRLVALCQVPERLTLVAPAAHIEAACTVVWRRGYDLGLRFES